MNGLPDLAAIRRVVAVALEEDLGERGDITSESVIRAGTRARGWVVARGSMVVAGLPVAREVFSSLDPTLSFDSLLDEGSQAARGDRLALVAGDARAILTGERTALNFLMRMCGIATAARAAVAEVSGTGAIILDTRKTAPGLRVLDKYAVAVGGATNHRMGLFDAVLIKDTHLAVAGATLEESVGRALARGHDPASLTVEVGSEQELDHAIVAGAGRALLDNMDLRTLRRCVERAGDRIMLEASGGLRPGGLRVVAEAGVRYLSIGWLTHSAPGADLALDLEAAG